jgi:hypothetical protein
MGGPVDAGEVEGASETDEGGSCPSDGCSDGKVLREGRATTRRACSFVRLLASLTAGRGDPDGEILPMGEDFFLCEIVRGSHGGKGRHRWRSLEGGKARRPMGELVPS